MQIPIYLDDDLAEKVNQRLPRNIKVSVLGRWLLRGLVYAKDELATICRDNDEEARTVAPYIVDALRSVYDAAQILQKEEKLQGP